MRLPRAAAALAGMLAAMRAVTAQTAPQCEDLDAGIQHGIVSSVHDPSAAKDSFYFVSRMIVQDALLRRGTIARANVTSGAIQRTFAFGGDEYSPGFVATDASGAYVYATAGVGGDGYCSPVSDGAAIVRFDAATGVRRGRTLLTDASNGFAPDAVGNVAGFLRLVESNYAWYAVKSTAPGTGGRVDLVSLNTNPLSTAVVSSPLTSVRFGAGEQPMSVHYNWQTGDTAVVVEDSNGVVSIALIDTGAMLQDAVTNPPAGRALQSTTAITSQYEGLAYAKMACAGWGRYVVGLVDGGGSFFLRTADQYSGTFFVNVGLTVGGSGAQQVGQRIA